MQDAHSPVEPLDWDSRYQAGDTPWDKGAPAPPLLEWLAKPGRAMHGEVLVPGCGLGHDVRVLAAASEDLSVVGLDISATALVHARSFPSSRGETYIEADLFALPDALRDRFDWVVEHTCFCAIPPSRRRDYVSAVAGALKSGGKLLAIFYMEPWGGGEQAPPGGGPPYGATVEELDGLFSTHFRVVEQYRPSHAYPGREGRELLRVLELSR